MYDYFRELRENREKALTVGLVITFLLLAVCWFSYCLGLRNAGGDVSDNGIRIDDVREQLSTAAEHQREITAGIGSAEAGAARIEGGVQRVSEAAERAEVAVGEAGRLLDECQQIIGTVRNRGKK